MEIKIYTSEYCKYCDDLKNKLTDKTIDFIEIDVDDKNNKLETEKVFKFAGEPIIPIIIIKTHMLIPKRSFTTIDQAISIIQTKIKELN